MGIARRLELRRRAEQIQRPPCFHGLGAEEVGPVQNRRCWQGITVPQ